MVKFSRVGKLDGIRSWSLEAGVSCPGSYDVKGELVDACVGCYAKSGNYRFPNVKQPREHNMLDWKRENWVADMIQELDNDRYFRWFDSGDIHHPDLAKKILAIVQATPWVKHWIPTRSYKLPRIREVLEVINQLPNVVVRYSSDSVNGEYEEIHGSTIIPTAEADNPELTICQAHQHGGRCKGCRQCWNPDVKIIAYPAHGKTMIKLLREKGYNQGV